MFILCPVRMAGEVREVIDAGAGELYCGLLPHAWKKKYTNVASMNRREFTMANMENPEELREVVQIAHERGVKVNLTMNFFYTGEQYPMLMEIVSLALDAGVDAFIVADLGFLVTLREMRLPLEIHISTGGTTFNRASVAFYREIGAKRIIIPRHVTVGEAVGLAEEFPDMEFEVFAMNGGCKNVDGFCTFQHGIAELRFGKAMDMARFLKIRQVMMEALRFIPTGIARALNMDVENLASLACLLPYQVTPNVENGESRGQMELARQNVASAFGPYRSMDTCAACRVKDFLRGGIAGMKIVGRERSKEKKVKDVTFLRRVMGYVEDHPEAEEAMMREEIKKIYTSIYRFSCGERCYYPI